MRRRFEQIGWIRFYLPDLESDFSRFHRITDIYSMPAPRFFAFARRIAAYDGILTRRFDALREREKKPAPARPRGASTRRPAATQHAAAGRLPEGASVVPVAAMGMNFPGLFERHKASPPPPAEGVTTPD